MLFTHLTLYLELQLDLLNLTFQLGIFNVRRHLLILEVCYSSCELCSTPISPPQFLGQLFFVSELSEGTLKSPWSAAPIWGTANMQTRPPLASAFLCPASLEPWSSALSWSAWSYSSPRGRGVAGPCHLSVLHMCFWQRGPVCGEGHPPSPIFRSLVLLWRSQDLSRWASLCPYLWLKRAGGLKGIPWGTKSLDYSCNNTRDNNGTGRVWFIWMSVPPISHNSTVLETAVCYSEGWHWCVTFLIVALSSSVHSSQGVSGQPSQFTESSSKKASAQSLVFLCLNLPTYHLAMSVFKFWTSWCYFPSHFTLSQFLSYADQFQMNISRIDICCSPHSCVQLSTMKFQLKPQQHLTLNIPPNTIFWQIMQLLLFCCPSQGNIKA